MHIVAGDDWVVVATVQGTSPYKVGLRFDRDAQELQVECNCPYFVDRVNTCKHIWAAILAADRHGALRAARRAPRLHLVPRLSDGGVASPVNGQEFVRDEPRRSAGPPGARRAAERGPPERAAAADGRPEWKRQIEFVRANLESDSRGPAGPALAGGTQLVYIIDATVNGAQGDGLRIEVARRRREPDGGWSRPQRAAFLGDAIEALPDRADRVILSLLSGAQSVAAHRRPHSARHAEHDSEASRFDVPPAAQPMLVEMMCRTGRCILWRGPDVHDPPPVAWDEGEPWDLWLQIAESPREYTITGSLRRGDQRLSPAEPLLLTSAGLLFTTQEAARFQHNGAYGWAVMLRRQRELKVPRAAGAELLEELLRLPRLPKLDLPPSLQYEQVLGTPVPQVTLRRLQSADAVGAMSGELAFDYEGTVVGALQPGPGFLRPQERRFLLRNAAAEAAAASMLRELGFRDAQSFAGDTAARFMIGVGQVPQAVQELTESNWHVNADGQVYHSGGDFHIAVSSGMDWFELKAEARFGERVAQLPELLEALRRGEQTVQLDDGTLGVLSDQVMNQLRMLAELGTAVDGGLRFSRSQVGLLDGLIAEIPEAKTDAAFAKARKELQHFEKVKPTAEPKGFKGKLRPYQKEGLGWLHFLQEFGFGGCLADDMGLGKTVQVLALLESRRVLRSPPKKRSTAAKSTKATTKPRRKAVAEVPKPGPTLVVVPRSLVFNWKQEAQRFAPKLTILEHTGASRGETTEHFADHDLVLTTYGTVRRDVAILKDVRFDYVILDEAQAIKNASTQAAKAVRLLQADHRLALSGTPIENHVGELWSLFEFLNPGMLGRGKSFQGSDARAPDEESRRVLGAALRPFILRRTKDQVAKDLPERLEQTLFCDLLPRDRRRYDELREHFRQSLLNRVERDGIKGSSMHVLEALLRLRQAACHPGLIDKNRIDEPSAKLELLLIQLDEVLEEGHKALVFSQFTSMLAIVRDRLDKQGVVYEYLDGRTRDRKSRVDRFQEDPECRLFLISLKAGGLGLNLTAAEYVFLLDPWWNPAVEAQAVDRAHRIGQTKAVFAFRLIARDTVEEKVLELQDSKRTLARDIINADEGLVKGLTRADLEKLLS